MTLGRLIAAVALALLGSTALAAPASAGAEDGRHGNGAPSVDIEVVAWTGDVGFSDSPWNDCTYSTLSVDDFVQVWVDGIFGGGLFGSDLFELISLIEALGEGYDLSGGFDYEGELRFFADVTCPGVLIGGAGRAVYPVGDPPQVVIDALAEIARSRITVSAFNGSTAPAGDLDAPLIKGLETFLWVDGSMWHPYTAEADLGGTVVVTVTATPVRTVWNPGDGGAAVTCTGPGTPFTGSETSTDCGYTYRKTTADKPGLVVPLTVTTYFDVTYSCVLAGGGGCATDAPLAGVSLSNTRNVAVGEIQTLGTG